MERILFLFLCLACNLAAQESPLTLRQGVEEITTHISQPKFEGATWGIEVQSLATGKILFEVANVPREMAQSALRRAAAKLGLRTRFVERVEQV